MAADPSTVEPSTLRAGDTWTWKRALSDYPAPTWTLAYSLINASAKITVTAAASGTDHLVTFAAATTAGYAAGLYSAIGRVASGAESYTVWEGQIEVLPNIAALTTHDDRSAIAKALDNANAWLAGNQSPQLAETQVGDRALKYWDPTKLLAYRDVLKAELAREEAASRLSQGMPGRGRIMVRM